VGPFTSFIGSEVGLVMGILLFSSTLDSSPSESSELSESGAYNGDLDLGENILGSNSPERNR
jgi:hypothetical protein